MQYVPRRPGAVVYTSVSSLENPFQPSSWATVKISCGIKLPAGKGFRAGLQPVFALLGSPKFRRNWFARLDRCLSVWYANAFVAMNLGWFSVDKFAETEFLNAPATGGPIVVGSIFIVPEPPSMVLASVGVTLLLGLGRHRMQIRRSRGRVRPF